MDGGGWSWLEVDGAGRRWIHGLVIPICNGLFNVRLCDGFNILKTC